MSHTTFGIDINKNSIRYAVCSVSASDSPISIIAMDSIKLNVTEDDDGLEAGFQELAARINQYKKIPLDAIGLSLDPTISMSVHRLFPFNDPKGIEMVLPQQLAEYWKVDDTLQISFEVGDFVPGVEGAEDEEAGGGYDVHAINYPREELKKVLDRLNAVQVDPHVVLPATEALNFAMNTIIKSPCSSYVILDIGDEKSMLSVVLDNRVEMTRSFKIGSGCIDSVLAETFEMTPEEARQIKMESGFIAVPGTEQIQFENFVSQRLINPCNLNPADISNACSRGLEMLMTAVRQTLSNFVAQKRIEPECVYLSGGGSKLCGLDAWLSELFDVKCVVGLPVVATIPRQTGEELSMDIDAAAVAVAASANIDNLCPLNLRRGAFAHKGSLAYLQDNKWIIASCVVLVIISLIFMTVTKAKAIQQEHDRLKAALEEATENVFGKKMLSYNQIEAEIESSSGFEFIPVRTAFTHFSWISSNVNDNLADVEMDLNQLDIDTQRKIVTIRGEVTGDEGLPRFMQLLEQYECFPNEIQEPKTTKANGRTSFTLRVDANQCTMGGDGE